MYIRGTCGYFNDDNILLIILLLFYFYNYCFYLIQVTMAESNHSGGGSACNGGSDSFKMLEKPASTGKERKLSSSQLELNRCLEVENVSEPLLKRTVT